MSTKLEQILDFLQMSTDVYKDFSGILEAGFNCKVLNRFGKFGRSDWIRTSDRTAPSRLS
jgi:hypothetical protein